MFNSPEFNYSIFFSNYQVDQINPNLKECFKPYDPKDGYLSDVSSSSVNTSATTTDDSVIEIGFVDHSEKSLISETPMNYPIEERISNPTTTDFIVLPQTEVKKESLRNPRLQDCGNLQ